MEPGTRCSSVEIPPTPSQIVEDHKSTESGFHGLSRHNWNLEHVGDSDKIKSSLLKEEGCRLKGSLEVNKVGYLPVNKVGLLVENTVGFLPVEELAMEVNMVRESTLSG